MKDKTAIDAFYSFFFVNGCTRRKIESSRKVFIRYDPIIHGAAATTRPCPRASLLITRISTFSTAHEDAGLSVTQTHVRNTHKHHLQPADGADLQLAA